MERGRKIKVKKGSQGRRQGKRNGEREVAGEREDER